MPREEVQSIALKKQVENDAAFAGPTISASSSKTALVVLLATRPQ